MELQSPTETTTEIPAGGTPAAIPAVPPAPAATPAPAAAPMSLGDPALTAPPVIPPAAVDVVVYDPTGDPGLDLALEFIGGLGFGPEREDMKLAMTGDFTKLEESLKSLGDKAKGFEKRLDLAKASFSAQAAKAKATEAETTKTVLEAVGGQDRWNSIQSWAAANADPAEKSAINAMLKAGGLQARAAAMLLSDLYKANGTDVKPKPAAQEGASSATPSSGALTAREFATESAKLHGKLGSRMESSPEYAALVARRRAARG